MKAEVILRRLLLQTNFKPFSFSKSIGNKSLIITAYRTGLVASSNTLTKTHHRSIPIYRIEEIRKELIDCLHAISLSSIHIVAKNNSSAVDKNPS